MMNYKYLFQTNVLKTLYYNFKLFPVSTARKIPLLIGWNSHLKLPRGSLHLDGPVQPGMITFGIGGSSDLLKYESRKNFFSVQKNGRVIFKGKAHFATHTSIFALGSTIEFGSGFSSNVGCRFSSVAGITFGENCLLGGSCVVRDSDGHRVFDCDEAFQKTNEHDSQKPVFIGDHVWIANNSSVLKGVTIPSDTIVSYGSIVVKSVEGTHQIIAGTPAKIVKSNIIWER